MKAVNSAVRKKDAIALVTGQPVYTEDLMPKDCLIVKVLRSPHGHALIEEIKTDKAMLVPGIEAIYTYKDVPNKRFTMAGQTYPEPSPYDRLILDRRVRFVGDAVAIVAGETEAAVDKALRMIKVKYQVLEPVLDFRTAKDNKILVHPEDNWKALCPVGADNKRNLCASENDSWGDVDKVLSECKYIIDETYHTQANQQTMMETFRAYSYLDIYGRLNMVASTQVPFHVRRILSHALDIPKSQIRIIKPRIGGGFGAKQTVVCEVYPALVTLKTGKPAYMVYTRKESQIASSPRHEMEMHVRLGADENGIIKAIDLYTLSNTGAYGEHGPTTVGLSGHKSISLYGKLEAYRFNYDVVYTNTMAAGAYRGYGATQGIFAIESAVNQLAAQLNMDPTLIREKNMIREGQVMPSYYGETANSCALDRCLARAKEMIGWDEKPQRWQVDPHTFRGLGMALAMQGSGISAVDQGSVIIKVNDDGFYSMTIGCADMGTGCDTILAQMAADCLDCSVDDIVVYGADTDISPYDSGSYASSTTYVTGRATMKACEELVEKIKNAGKEVLGCEEVEFDGKYVFNIANKEEKVSLKDLGNQNMAGKGFELSSYASFCSPISPPPYMVGIAEVEVDIETGKVDVVDYVAVVDCGTVINTNLARVQAEGGILQGIGMCLFEDVRYDSRGYMTSNSFMQYKIPTRLDIGQIRVEFESSYEPTGPFGAKSIGEIVIDTPSPAIAAAIYAATKKRFYELPITSEKIAMAIAND